MRPTAGAIVVSDSRGGAFRGEPNKLRPAVVIHNEKLFARDYGLLCVVPITCDAQWVHPSFSVRLDPTEENGCIATAWILANAPTIIAAARCSPTASSITDEQLQLVRQRVAYLIGFPQVSPLLASFLDAGSPMDVTASRATERRMDRSIR